MNNQLRNAVRRAICATGMVAVSGCATMGQPAMPEMNDPMVKGRASTELSCYAKKVRVYELEHARIAVGCGKYLTYTAAGVPLHGPRSLKGHRLPPRTRELTPVAATDLGCAADQVQIRATDSDYIAEGCGKFAAYGEDLKLEKPAVAVDMSGLPPFACSEQVSAPAQDGEEEVTYPQEVHEYAVNGTQVFACVIEANGTVDRCQTIVGFGHGATEAALTSLSKRKFTPAKCGEKPLPVPFEFDIHVNPPLPE